MKADGVAFFGTTQGDLGDAAFVRELESLENSSVAVSGDVYLAPILPVRAAGCRALQRWKLCAPAVGLQQSFSRN